MLSCQTPCCPSLYFTCWPGLSPPHKGGFGAGAEGSKGWKNSVMTEQLQV